MLRLWHSPSLGARCAKWLRTSVWKIRDVKHTNIIQPASSARSRWKRLQFRVDVAHVIWIWTFRFRRKRGKRSSFEVALQLLICAISVDFSIGTLRKRFSHSHWQLPPWGFSLFCVRESPLNPHPMCARSRRGTSVTQRDRKIQKEFRVWNETIEPVLVPGRDAPGKRSIDKQ